VEEQAEEEDIAWKTKDKSRWRKKKKILKRKAECLGEDSFCGQSL
jgi:hypothetical protein